MFELPCPAMYLTQTLPERGNIVAGHAIAQRCLPAGGCRSCATVLRGGIPERLPLIGSQAAPQVLQLCNLPPKLLYGRLAMQSEMALALAASWDA